ncbi:MAG: Ig-like domain-containing protein [Myxococcota bacterium]|nr:Ig-like domain-containing protein [Myxococcota bacterium]
MRIACLTLPLILCCNDDRGAPDKGGGAVDTASAGADDGVGTGGGGAGDGGEEPDPCLVEVVDVSPADGAADHDYRAPLVFTLDGAAPGAVLSVVDEAGSPVAGRTEPGDGDTTWTFRPDPELLPETAYIATLSFCGNTDEPASVSVAFTTMPLVDPFTCDLTGRTFWVDLQTATWTEPAGVAPLLLGGLDNDILLGVARHEGAEIEIFGGADDGARAQDFCQATWAFPAGDFSLAPSFSVGPEDTAVSFNGFPVTMEQLAIHGDFSADCTSLEDAHLTAQIDVRTIKELVGELLGVDEPDTICTLMAGFGTSCDACPSDGEPYCIPVEVADATGAETGATMTCVAEAYCHPLCARNDSDCDVADFPECE